MINPIKEIDSILVTAFKELGYTVRWRFGVEDLSGEGVPLIAIEYETWTPTESAVVKDNYIFNGETDTYTKQAKAKDYSVRYALHLFSDKIRDLSEMDFAIRAKLNSLSNLGTIYQNQTLILAPEKVGSEKFYHAVLRIRIEKLGVFTEESAVGTVKIRDFEYYDSQQDSENPVTTVTKEGT